MEIVDTLLRSTGWKPVPSGALIKYADEAGLVTAVGLRFQAGEDRPELIPVLNALMEAFNAEGILTIANRVIVTGDAAKSETNKNRNAIHIFVGSKPIN
jgi:nicotinamidase-related amidase